MEKNDVSRIIEEMLLPCLLEEGLELFEIIVKRPQNFWNIEVLIDKPQGGIALDLCVKVNRYLISKLEETQDLGDDYALQVSSPGLDRALKTIKDYKRLEGKDVFFILKEKIEGKGEWIGPISNIREDRVSVSSGDVTIDIPFNLVTKAIQHI